MSRFGPRFKEIGSFIRPSGIFPLLAIGGIVFTGFQICQRIFSVPLATPAWTKESTALIHPAMSQRKAFQTLSEPLQIRPCPIVELQIPQQTRRALQAVAPYFDRRKSMEIVPLTAVLHSLRLWGPNAEFAKLPQMPIPLSGTTMADILLDHATLIRHCHLYGPGLLRSSEYGIEVIISRDFSFKYTTSATHFGELLDSLAETGIRSDHPVSTLDGHVGTVAEIVTDDAARCVHGTELEFVTSALCRYAKNDMPWTNRFGQEYSFDKLASELLSARQKTGSCDGTHVPYTLVVLSRSDQIRPLLSDAMRREIRSYLVELSTHLTECQSPDGCWGKDWRDPHPTPEGLELDDETFMRVVRVTSHHLEWMAMEDTADLRPQTPVMRRAVSFLLDNWNRIEYCLKEDWHHYGNVSHVARSLALISGYENLTTIGPPAIQD